MRRLLYIVALFVCAAFSTTTPSFSSSSELVDVAIDKPVLETFSGSGDNATSSSPLPAIGWFSTAFPDFPDHTLYPETLLLDLLGVFNISAVIFYPPSNLLNYTIFVGMPGEPFWIPVTLLSPTAFVPIAARYVRFVVTAVDSPSPNFTISVARIGVLGLPTALDTAATAWPPPPSHLNDDVPSSASAARLQTERRTNPIDVDTLQPLLSWTMASNRTGDTVTAWRVIVNRSLEIVWDSGRINETAFSCEAQALFMSGDALTWSVRLWDMKGVPTDWAPTATFSIAKRNQTDWSAQWIGGNSSLLVAGVNGPGHPAVYLRGLFYLSSLPLRAVASFSGLGWGKLFIDGNEASNLELSPGYTTYEYRTQFNVLDVTNLLLHSGRVVLSAILGDGWYALAHDPSCCAHYQNQPYVNSTRLLLDLDMWFADGSHTRVSSNASWQWALGEITSSWLAGESVDKTRALPQNWTTAFDDVITPTSTWQHAVLVDGPPAIFNGSVMTAQKEPPTIRGELFTPQTMFVVPDMNVTGGSVFIFDLGREIQGRPVITATANTPTLLRIIVCGSFYFSQAFTCDENTVTALNAGDGPSLYNFTLAGTGTNEIYEPLFTYVAVKRIVIHVPAGVSAPTCSVRMIAMSQPSAGSIVTSSDTYNWLHSALARTQVHYTTGFPNDPSRERVGYTQDVQNMFRGAAYEFTSSELMYSRWLTDMADGQEYSYTHPGSGIPAGGGQMPTVIPGPKSDNANSVFWGGMLVWLPWRHFLHYGDVRVLTKYYDNLVAYVDYLSVSAPTHIVDWGLADWNSPLPECSGWGFHATPIINTPGLYLLSKTLGEIANFLGHDSDAARFTDLSVSVGAAYNAAFLNTSSGMYSTGQQCHQAIALAMEGLVPDSMRAAAVAQLVNRIASDNFTLTVGFVSFLHEVLVLADEDPALMHTIITRRNYGPERFTHGCTDKDGPGGKPSTAWGCAPGLYAMTVGASPSNDLAKESWQGSDAMMPSLSGPFLVHSYHTLAGIRTSETLAGAGFRNFTIMPSPVPELLWLNASVDSPLGFIIVNWRVVLPSQFFLQVIIPPGASALVGIPSASSVVVNDSLTGPLEDAQWRAGRSYVRLGSGQFFFNSTLPEAVRGVTMMKALLTDF